jgi:SAM-dependent methyltransferase
MTTGLAGGSPSLARPEYWWYRARADLLRTVLEEHVGEPARVLDVGSADGPSVAWLHGHGRPTSLDLDIRGLGPGGVCGSAAALPFRDASFDVVAAFDVLEHCADEHLVLTEVARVLTPGGRLLLSVPAYAWAWSDFDEQNGHYRRYTRPRAVAAVRGAGFVVERATYAFSSVFPFFAAERLTRRAARRLAGPTIPREAADGEPSTGVVPLPQVHPVVERMLMRLSSVDRRLLARTDLPFGSSVMVAATKAAG